MKIVSSFLPPSRGCVKVAGFDVQTQSRQVCQNIGFLPENMPVYPELRVKEYLRHRALIRGLSSKKAKLRIAELCEICELDDAMRNSMDTLSKGFRQRVGLADALLLDPPVLILDEPTSGLDPRQLRSFRELISSFSGNKTILISSHVLGEIEQMCDRVVILAHGKIQIQEDRKAWQARLNNTGRLYLEFSQLDKKILSKLNALDGVNSSSHEGSKVQLDCDQSCRAAVFELCKSENWTLIEMHWKSASLEDLFIEMTGSHSHE